MERVLRQRWLRGKKRTEGRLAPGRAPSRTFTSAPVNFQTLVEQSVDMIWQVKHLADGSMEYEYMSPSTAEVTGWTADEMRYVPPDMLYPPASLASIGEAGMQLAAGAASAMVTVEAIRKDGRHIWLENRVCTLKVDPDGSRTVVVCMRDVTDRKLLQDQLASLVLVDALTGVGNRRAFDSTLDREWQRALQRQSALSLLLIDVDHFKTINDRHGHQVGDECLRMVAQKVCQLLNRPETFVARYGGDELAVLLPGVDMTEARDLSDGLCRGIEASILLPADQRCAQVTISCGASTVLGVPEGVVKRSLSYMPAALVAAADRALYSAKNLGRNRAAIAEVA